MLFERFPNPGAGAARFGRPHGQGMKTFARKSIYKDLYESSYEPVYFPPVFKALPGEVRLNHFSETMSPPPRPASVYFPPVSSFPHRWGKQASYLCDLFPKL